MNAILNADSIVRDGKWIPETQLRRSQFVYPLLSSKCKRPKTKSRAYCASACQDFCDF